MAGSKQQRPHRSRKPRKHRGTQAGTVKQNPRRRAKGRSTARPTAQQRRQERFDRPPSWRTAIGRALMTAALLFVVFGLFLRENGFAGAARFAIIALVAYIPLFYFFDSFMYQRRQRQKAREAAREAGHSKDS